MTSHGTTIKGEETSAEEKTIITEKAREGSLMTGYVVTLLRHSVSLLVMTRLCRGTMLLKAGTKVATKSTPKAAHNGLSLSKSIPTTDIIMLTLRNAKFPVNPAHM